MPDVPSSLQAVSRRLSARNGWGRSSERTNLVSELTGADYLSLIALFVAWVSTLLFLLNEPNWAILTMFVAFLLPTFPDDALCLVAGLTTIRLRTFLTLLVVVRTPTFVAAAYAGTALADDRVERFLLILAGRVLLSAVVYGLRSRITERPDRLTDRGG